jgi:hypothetical protein
LSGENIVAWFVLIKELQHSYISLGFEMKIARVAKHSPDAPVKERYYSHKNWH